MRLGRSGIALLVLLALAGVAAWIPPQLGLPREEPLAVDCVLLEERKPEDEIPSWCPLFVRIYHCSDRIIVVTQAVDKDPLTCLRVQISQLMIGLGV